MNPRREPLLWLQLIALGAMPLELLLLLLVLAGADPGPWPGLERLLVWGLGALAPTIVLWRRPADCCSLLLVQVPLGARTAEQRQLAALQEQRGLRALLPIAALSLLPLLWRLDGLAAAAPFSPLSEANRLVSLLLAIPLLALLVWQWQQLLQAIALLSRGAAGPGTPAPLSQRELEERRLSLGLPLLLLKPLQGPADAAGAPDSGIAAAGGPIASTTSGAVAVEPEQAAEGAKGGDLNQEID